MHPVSAEPLDLQIYLESTLKPDDELLQRLVRDTYAHTVHPRMLGGPVLASLLRVLVALCPPRRILEIGTFTGYTTIQLARAARDAEIWTCEPVEAHASIAARYLEEARVAARVHLALATAQELIPSLAPPFDLVFLDGDKADYPEYLSLVRPLLPVGALLVADNTLWGGKVANPAVKDARTDALRTFNSLLANDPEFTTSILPVRDGVTLAVRC